MSIVDMLDFSARETTLYLACAECGGQIEMRSDGSVIMPKHERTRVMYSHMDGIPLLAFFCSQRCSDRAQRREGQAK